MCPLDNIIREFPKKDQPFVGETISELWDILEDLRKKGYLRPTLESKQRKDFPEILRTSDRLIEVFNMLFSIPDANGKFAYGRNKEFVQHNRKYGFNEKTYAYLLLSESLSIFLRNVELFRSCFLFVVDTTKRPFFHTMGIGQLLNQLVTTCGSKGQKIKDKVDFELRNGLTHGLMWIDRLIIHYSKDITFTERGKIGLDELWKKARDQNLVTQCLIRLIPVWYSGDC